MSEELEGRPPYVRCWPPVPIEVEQDGGWFPGLALAYTGERVTVRFTVDVGMTYQQAVDASRVRRV